jgi:hypothetical protein
MKKVNYLATTALAAGGLLLGGMAARAQDVQSPTGAAPASGDLIAAFYVPDGSNSSGDTGGGFTYEVDLGSLASLGSGASFNLSTDLASIYGGSGADAWFSATRPDALFWTVFGANTTTNEFWTTDTPSGAGITERIGTNNTNPSALMGVAYGDLGQDPFISSGDPTAADLSNSSDPQDFANEYTNDWGYVGWGSGGPLTDADSFAPVNFYDVVPHSGTTTPASEVGTFTLASNGELTYSSTAVPEPSTWASIIVGAVGLLAFRRRRMAA